MSVFINFVCDHSDCKNMQSAGFDHQDETWGDMIKALIDVGWLIELKDHKVIKAICPVHK